MLMFGGEAAILLAAIEAFTSTIRFSKRPLVGFFNAGVMASSTAITAAVVSVGFGAPSTLPAGPLHTLVMALSVMALVQYGLNSGLVAVSAALKKADFTSLRGGFKFNSNGYPIQDFYLTKVAKRADGKFQTEIVEKVFKDYGDRYARDCVPGN